MSKESLIFLLGLIVLLVPFVGIPNDWKRIVLAVCGVLIMLIGYVLRRAAFLRSIETDTGERHGEAFVESNPSETHDPLFSDESGRV